MDMTNESLSDIQPDKVETGNKAAAAPTVPGNPEGIPSPNVQIDVAKAIGDASATALLKHSVESGGGKKSPGRPRKYPGVVGATVPGLPSSFPINSDSEAKTQVAKVAVPSLDKETCKILVEGFLDIINEVAVNIVEHITKSHTKSDIVALECGKRAKMGEKTQKMIDTGLCALGEQHADKLGFAPAIAVVAGLGIWAGSNYLMVREILKSPKGVDKPVETK